MMHVENVRPNLLERIRRFIGPRLDRINLEPSQVVPLVSGCFGFKRDGRWTGGWMTFGRSDKDVSLFYNGIFYFRLMLPFFVGVGIRWRGRAEGREFLQTYAGWKLNGEFSIVFRVQSDKSAAVGTTGPNFGQAAGWDEGTK